jgi:hypothetical protein
LIRFLVGQGAREALQEHQKKKKLKKSPNNSQKKSLNNKFTKNPKIKTLSTQSKKIKIRNRGQSNIGIISTIDFARV